MRLRLVVAFLALLLSVQTALAAVCAAGCATMTAGASHHGAPEAPAAALSPDAHHGHHAVAEQVSSVTANSVTANPVSITAASMQCPLPEAAKQRPRSELESTFADASPSPLPLVSSSAANRSPSATVPPDLSPPARFTVLRI